jgi:hypothetical protein
MGRRTSLTVYDDGEVADEFRRFRDDRDLSTAAALQELLNQTRET